MSDASTPAEAPQGQSVPEQGSPEEQQAFFEYSYLDGSADRFDSREDLEKAWRDSHFRQADYTRKTQSLSEERKAFEEERKKQQEQYQQFLDTKRRYDDMDASYQSLSPQAQRELERLTREQVGPDDVLERSQKHTDSAVEELRNELKSLQEEREAEKRERELEDLMGRMGTKYEDFNRDKALEMLDALGDGNPEPLMELVYWAQRGQGGVAGSGPAPENTGPTPARAARLPSANGGTPKSETGNRFASLDEAADAALKEYAGVRLPS